jgi:hypothetical protein
MHSNDLSEDAEKRSAVRKESEDGMSRGQERAHETHTTSDGGRGPHTDIRRCRRKQGRERRPCAGSAQPSARSSQSRTDACDVTRRGVVRRRTYRQEREREREREGGKAGEIEKRRYVRGQKAKFCSGFFFVFTLAVLSVSYGVSTPPPTYKCICPLMSPAAMIGAVG